jgi:2-keto-3-deoxy-L-rhamnonate aldolase RhmA
MPTELRTRLRSRERLFGGWTSIGHPSITEIVVSSGIDFMGIDLEHSTINHEQAQRIIAASQAAGIPCLPRVASHEAEQIRRLMDSGADGVIVPMVSTVAQIRDIVSWCKYPPLGSRSYGVARAHGYGSDFDTYIKGWNARSAILIQIESIQGVEAVQQLVAEDSIDGVLVGPYDLSGSLDIPGELSHPKVIEACSRVIQTCRKAGKSCGTHIVDPTTENVNAAFDAGYSFVVLASDVFILATWSERMRALIPSVRSGASR